VQIYDLLDNHPSLTDKDVIFFRDRFSSSHFGQKTDHRMTLLTNCLKSLAFVAENFTALEEAWRNCLVKFDHVAFWDNLLQSRDIELQFERLIISQKNNVDIAGPPQPDFRSLKELKDAILPPDFTDEGYLAKNPDVREAGFPPRRHWLEFGRHEGRKY